mgnify:CR=1 FL=1
MSDIVERLRTHCIDLEGGIRDEEILAAADEITRIRSLLKEAGEALDDMVMAAELPGDHCELHCSLVRARSVLSKIKGEA